MANELKQKMKKGGIGLLLSNLSIIISQVAFIFILSKLLSPSDFGYQGITVMVAELIAVFTYPAINKAIILRKDVTREFLDNTTIISFLLCAGLSVLFFSAAPIIGFAFHQVEYGVISAGLGLILLFRGIYQPYQALYEKELRFTSISRVNLVAYWVGYFIIPLAMALMHFGYLSLIAGLVIYELVLTIFYVRKTSFQFRKLNKDVVKEVMQDSRNIILHTLGNKLATNGDNLVISVFLGPAAVGYYSQAYKIMKMPTTMIANLLNNMSFASFSAISEDDEKLSKAFRYSSFLLALFSFPILVITFVFAKEIVLLLLGKQWLPTVAVLQILALGIFFRMAYKVPGSILRAKAKFALTARLQWIYAAGVIGLSLLLIGFSIEGVAVGTLLALVLQYVQVTYHVNKTIGATPFTFYAVLIKPIIFSAAILGVCVALKYAGNTIVQWGEITVFIVSASIICISSAAFIWWKGKQFFGEPYSWWLHFFTEKKQKKKKTEKPTPALVA